MKKFLEIIEQLEEGEIKTPKIVKIEVKDIEEALTKLKEEELKFEGLKYIKRFHVCYHPEGEYAEYPCGVQEL